MNEKAFRDKEKGRCPASMTEKEIEQHILLVGKKRKVVCVEEKDIRMELVNLFLCHLRWHPYVHCAVSPDQKVRHNITEVHCKVICELTSNRYAGNKP